MKKQELIHIHNLLSQINGHYQMEKERLFENSRYEELGVKPTSIHKSKTDHKDAVFELARSLTRDMELNGSLEDDSDVEHYSDVIGYLEEEEEATPGEIADETGYSRERVRETLNDVDEYGLMDLDERGQAELDY